MNIVYVFDETDATAMEVAQWVMNRYNKPEYDHLPGVMWAVTHESNPGGTRRALECDDPEAARYWSDIVPHLIAYNKYIKNEEDK